jgi:hypothetical protein
MSEYSYICLIKEEVEIWEINLFQWGDMALLLLLL